MPAGQHDLAATEALLREVIERDPSNTDAMFTLGWLLRDAGRAEDAACVFEQMIQLQPDDFRAHDGRGVALGDLGRREEAHDSLERAQSLNRDSGQAWQNLAVAQLRLGRFAEAVAGFQHALELGHRPASLYAGLGLALFRSRRHRDAIEMFERAIALNPNDARTRYFLGECHLALGEFQPGWAGFEFRQHFLSDLDPAGFTAPRWLGDFPIHARTILVHSEQRFGDTLQFCRYVPMLASYVKLVLRVPPPLHRLLSGLDESVTLVPSDATPPRYDMWVPLMSLPMIFGTTLSSIPSTVPYLNADPNFSAKWRALLASLPGRKVGLVWAGSRYDGGLGGNNIDSRRSITLDDYAPLGAVPGLSLISLQKGEPSARASTPPDGMVLHDWTGDLEDFADTAALVEALDLVITIDTSVAHVAGAMGKPVWVLTLHDHCWRWLIGRSDSPWYPTMRIFQQPTPGDWDGVIRAVTEALR